MWTELPPAKLLNLCVQRAHQDAWQEFVRRYHPVIANSVARITNQYGIDGPQAVEDIVQEVYLKLCEKSCKILRDFREDREDGLFAFLKVISANTARDRCQAMAALKRGGGKLVPLDSHDEAITAEGELSSRLAQQLFLENVETILAGLTQGPTAERDQSVFWLYYRQGWTAREIADIPVFELSAKGVESLLHRLVRQVRLVLERTTSTASTEGPGTANPFL
ncbi:MAG TPA: sigma-70 family RNA polymerase sigma factor [Bryobacteraceae bacterium]|nr:sigma-70 family RNA polymerase sigma factor [Bryobacteraceae bacterium]